LFQILLKPCSKEQGFASPVRPESLGSCFLSGAACPFGRSAAFFSNPDPTVGIIFFIGIVCSD
jgi:hypothetical protein